MSKHSLLDDRSPLEIEQQEAVETLKETKKSNKIDYSNPSHISVSIGDVSCAIDNEGDEKEGYITGAILMIITTLMWTLIHVSSKIMYLNDPQMNGFDVVSVMAYTLIPFFYIYAKIRGVNCNLFSFEPKLRILLVFRVSIGLINNIFLFIGLQYVSVGKGILIWSLSPLFCAITARIFLKESITVQSIVLILVSI